MKEFWNDIINEVQLMSEEEFSDFVDECEKTPEILLTSLGNNIYELPKDLHGRSLNKLASRIVYS